MNVSRLEIILTVPDNASGRAATDAFGLDDRTIHKIKQKGSITLVATPHQFGLFVALRNAYGGDNWIKAMNPKLIPDPRQLPDKIDVTGYQAAA